MSDRIKEVDLLLGQKNSAWFTQNSGHVLRWGQIVFLVNTGRFKIGNDSTTLGALPFYGGVVATAWADLTGDPADSATLVAYLTGNYEQLTNKGAVNGYASLDGGGKVPSSQLPANVMQYQGQWDAATNNPVLTNGVGSAGDVYEVIVAGTHDFGAGNITFKLGDWAVYSNSGIWEKSTNSNEVVSVNGYTGAVSLIAHDLLMTGYPGASPGTVGAADSIRTAISKLDGNFAAQESIVTTIVTSSTPTPVISAARRIDHLVITALNTNMTLQVPTGASPVDCKMLMVAITGDATPRTIAYNGIYVGSTSMSLPAITQASKTIYLGFRYNAVSAKYHLISKTDGYT